MIEPTETESKAALDRFVEVMTLIAREAADDPQKLLDAPHTTPVRRIDEVKAAREPNVRWKTLKRDSSVIASPPQADEAISREKDALRLLRRSSAERTRSSQ